MLARKESKKSMEGKQKSGKVSLSQNMNEHVQAGGDVAQMLENQRMKMGLSGQQYENGQQSKISEYKPLKLYHVENKTFENQIDYSKDELTNIGRERDTMVNY